MPEAIEIPEASSALEKRIALTIAILAVVLSFVNLKGDDAKTESIIKTNKASDQWSYYQAKSIKGHIEEMHVGLLKELGGVTMSEEATKALTALAGEVGRLKTEKAEVQKAAKEFEEEAEHLGKIRERCDHAALLLQIGIVICSVAILSEWKPFWYIGIALGLVGVGVGVTAFLN